MAPIIAFVSAITRDSYQVFPEKSNTPVVPSQGRAGRKAGQWFPENALRFLRLCGKSSTKERHAPAWRQPSRTVT
jgi:hypothetical protein